MTDVSLRVGDLLREAASRLGRAGVAGPTQEALRLWAGLRHESPGAAYLARDEAVEPERLAAFEAAVSRRERGEPLAYVVGWTGFRHLVLRTDPRALIPRPETEGLVEHVLLRVSSGRVADVGTGSGCIALSLATEGSYQRVVAVDASPAALELARANAAELGVDVAFVRGDLCAPLASGRFDAVVANPPYLSEAEYAVLDASVRGWEPAMALVSGPSGLDATRRLLDEARRVLRPAGWLALEVDCRRARAVATEAERLGWDGVEVHEDLFGRARYVLARRSDAP
ncbi:MAG TPA: peptide chain release factor N(5)-glutamine methyltransferase [Gemmatimonadales bacterium]|nr:peptide chain release factor N(5)-glutamine methyltransferase [Gemmatimonadales bacterium]